MEQQVEETGDSAAIVGQADVSEADLAQALARLPGGNKRPWVYPVLMVVAVLSYMVMTPSATIAETWLTFALPAACVAGGSWYFHVAARRAWIKQGFANVGGPTTFRFDDFGFSSESKLRQHRMAWAALALSLETPEAFLIYTTPRTVLIVPKHAFTSAQIAALHSLLPERITPQPVEKVGLTGRASARGTLALWVMLVVAFLSIWHFLSIDNAPQRRERQTRQAAAEPAELSGEGGASSDYDSEP